ncbi:hypothetical protein KKF38_00840 [Patescibacteria group bacterium]|nr:hypothetical protein [Patescibacteria group bacterium]
MLFKILPKNRIEEIREKSLSDFSEKNLEDLLAENLSKIFPNLIFVSRQFSVNGLFFDILAFDREQNSPVIFELKKDRAREIVAQGLQYFRFLSTKKEKFIFEFLNKKIISRHDEKINWDSSKLIFVAREFPEREIDSSSFNLPIELFKFSWFKNDNFILEKVERKKEKPKIGEVLKNPEVEKITREFKEYDRDFHQKKASEKTWQLFEKIENELSRWGNIEKNYRKLYISFFLKNSFCVAKILKSKIQIEFGKKKDVSLFKKFKNVNNISSKDWNHALMIEVENENDLDDLFFILKKSYKFISQK